MPYLSSVFFFFNDTATTEIYTLSLHDALPIYANNNYLVHLVEAAVELHPEIPIVLHLEDRNTRLNSSHQIISYAVFCLKKKKNVAFGTAPTLSPEETFAGTFSSSCH